MPSHKLSAKAVENATFTGSTKKLSDGEGLHLLVNKSGKYWRYSYRYEKRQKTLALGAYPKVSLSKARTNLSDAQKLLEDGIDPSAERAAAKQGKTEALEHTVETVAREWLAKQQKWAESHRVKVAGRLKKDVYPTIGHLPVSTIKPTEVLDCLYLIEKRGAVESAHRVRQTLGQVFRYAVQTGRAERNPIPDTKGALTTVESKQYPFISEPKKVGALMRAIDGFDGTFIVHSALKLAPLVFVRPGELRGARWDEIDLKAARWVIPADRMKAGIKHTVPLSKQTIKILKELHRVTGRDELLFPRREIQKQAIQ